MKTSKSPNAVAVVAYATAKRALPQYLHLKSPKKFTQHQLVACLVLKEFFTTDYRGIAEILTDSQDLKHILELDEVPHYTTLQETGISTVFLNNVSYNIIHASHTSHRDRRHRPPCTQPR